MNGPDTKRFLRHKRVRWALAVLLVLSGIGTTFWLLESDISNPLYHGKRLSDYVTMLPATIDTGNGILRVYVSESRRPTRLMTQEQAAELEKIRQTSGEARDAIRVMGEQCLPLLTHWFERRQPALERGWEQTYLLLSPLLRRAGMGSNFNPLGCRTEARRWQAVTALMELRDTGIDLKPLVPRLKSLAQDKQKEIRRAARFMLRQVDREAFAQLEDGSQR
jgi:hypothetical protein